MTTSERVYFKKEHEESIPMPEPRETYGDERGWVPQYVANTARAVHVKYNDDGEPTAVTVFKGIHYRGISLRNHVKYSHWNWDNRTIFRRTKSGRITATRFDHKGRDKAMSSAHVKGRERSRYDDDLTTIKTDAFFSTDARYPSEVADLIFEYLGEPRARKEFYPLAEEYRLFEHIADPKFIAAFELSETPRDLALKLFGKKNFRKPLVKATAQADVRYLYMAWCLRSKEVPIEWFINYLREHPRDNETDDEARRDRWFRPNPAKGMRDHLRRLDSRSIRRILHEDWNQTLVNDIPRQRVDPNLTHVDSLEDLHNKEIAYTHHMQRIEREIKAAKDARERARMERYWASPEGQARRARELAEAEARRTEEERIRAERERQWEEERKKWEEEMRKANAARFAARDEAVKKLSGTRKGIKWVVGKDGKQLTEWGTLMNNCIGGYSHHITNATGILLGFYRGDKLIANAEIDIANDGSMRIVQLLGERSRNLKPETVETILGHMTKCGVDSSGQWWGKPDQQRAGYQPDGYADEGEEAPVNLNEGFAVVHPANERERAFAF